MSQPTAETFLKDVESHRMTVLSDNGVNRSLKFENPNCSNLHFFITTWPGHLCISGDMGTFVFARIHDMFEFFENIDNAGYYTEKLVAGVASEYCQETAKNDLIEIVKHAELTPDKESVAGTYVDRFDFYDEYSYVESIRNWDEHEAGFELEICDLSRPVKPTYHYIWCMHAIIWAIQQYNKLRKSFPAKDITLRTAMLMDSQYMAGLKAGWNMGVCDDEERYQQAYKIRMSTFLEARRKLKNFREEKNC